MIYAIIENNNNFILERTTEENYEFCKKNIKSFNYIYVAKEIDEIILNYGFKQIIWTRFFNPFSKKQEKITVNFEPDDFEKMNYEAQIILEQKKENVKKIKENKRIKHEEKLKDPMRLERIRAGEERKHQTDILFEKLDNEMDVMKLWKEMNFITPPPTKIAEIKKSFPNKTWKEFKEIVNSLI